MNAGIAIRTTPPFLLPVPDISAWCAGNTGTQGVWQFDSGQSGRHVLITALVHGNGLCGAWALKGLLEAGIRPQRGMLTLTFCNLAAFDRFDPAHHDASRFTDEDLNRQWTGTRIDAVDTQKRRRAAALRPFMAQADWLLDIHSMHEPSPPLLLTGMFARNRALTRALRSPEHIVVDAGHTDGVRMRDYGQFGLPDATAGDKCALLIECGFHGDPASRAVAQDQCVRFLAQSGALSSNALTSKLPLWRLPDAARQWALEVTDAVVATSSTFHFAAPYAGLETLARAGTVIGHNDGIPVVTP